MKVCPHCQAQLTDDTVFCTTCGAQQAAPAPAPAPVATQAPVAPMYPYPAPPKQVMTVGGWIGRSLIPCIPIVGSIVYLIMLFIWMGDETKEESFRNWAKAQLIVMLIAIGIVVLLFVLIFAVLGFSFAAIADSPAYYY